MGIKLGFAKRKKLIIGIPVVVLLGIVLSAIGTAYYFKRIKKITNADLLATIAADTDTDGENPVEKADIGEFGLEIAKINVWSPIIDNVDDSDEAQYLKAIENGVALSKNYAKSPKEKGNLFVFGHSKYYKNKPGNYKEVFRDLNSLKVGEKFNIYYKRDKYVYEVTASKAVAADDFSIRDATPNDANDKTLTLMTCWPPGTTDKRWIIFAKQV